MSSPRSADDMKQLTYDYPSIVSRPTTTIPFFPKPPGFSLFHLLFSRFSDAAFFLAVSLLSFTGLVATGFLHQTTLGRTERIFLLGFSIGVGYPFLYLYFSRIHQWRKTDFAKRWFFTAPSLLHAFIGNLVKIAGFTVYAWAGFYSAKVAVMGLLGLIVLLCLYLAMRPVFDYSFFDGSLTGLIMYVCLAKKDPNATNGDGDSLVVPVVVGFVGWLIIMFRHYVVEKALIAENPKGDAN